MLDFFRCYVLETFVLCAVMVAIENLGILSIFEHFTPNV